MSGACRKTFAWDENHPLQEDDIEIHSTAFERRNPLMLVENRQKFRFYVEIYEQAGALQLIGFKGKPTFERISPHEIERIAGYVDVSPRAVLREIGQFSEK